MKMTANRRALDKIYKRRDRYDIPDWQREQVWNKGKKQKLIRFSAGGGFQSSISC